MHQVIKLDYIGQPVGANLATSMWLGMGVRAQCPARDAVLGYGDGSLGTPGGREHRERTGTR